MNYIANQGDIKISYDTLIYTLRSYLNEMNYILGIKIYDIRRSLMVSSGFRVENSTFVLYIVMHWNLSKKIDIKVSI